MEGKVVLKVEGLNKSFGPTKAVVDMHLEIHPGEIHGLIGENGSGKSTVTSMIAGCLKPDSDADILVLDGDELKLYEMYAKGKKMMAEGKPIVKGYFEK